MEDIQKLTANERVKWEIAAELGLFDKVTQRGWKGLTSRESGKIGGIMSSREKKTKEEHAKKQ